MKLKTKIEKYLVVLKQVKKNILRAIIISSILIFILWMSVYFLKFSGQLSRNQSDWGNFSSYASAITGIISLIILVYLTYSIHRESALIQVRLERPVLTFSFDVKSGHYHCVNIGKGPAINIIIVHKLNEKQSNYDLAVHCFSLQANDRIPITWIKGTAELHAIYYDIFKAINLVKFENDKMLEMIFDDNKLKDLIEWSNEDEVKKLFGQEVLDNILLYDAVNRTP